MNKIELRFPFTFEGEEITHVEMRAPIVRDHIYIKSKFGTEENPIKRKTGTGTYDDDDRNMEFLARLTDKPIEFIYSLSLADLGKLSNMFDKLTDPSMSSQSETETD